MSGAWFQVCFLLRMVRVDILPMITSEIGPVLGGMYGCLAAYEDSLSSRCRGARCALQNG